MNSPKPKTQEEFAAYRCQLSCKIGRDALSGESKTPDGVSPIEYAIFNLLHAVEELSKINIHQKANEQTAEKETDE